MSADWEVTYYPSIGSTQDEARKTLTGIHWTTDQTAGRGRYDRKWHSEPGQSLAVSICFPEHVGFDKPYLIGMWLAVGMAECFNLRLQWPNDLTLYRKKVGGILTEVIDGVPVVGIGLNFGRMKFPPDLADRATSIGNEKHMIPLDGEFTMKLMTQVLGYYLRNMPKTWSEMESHWRVWDETKGKLFRRYDGRVGLAEGVSGEGELLWSSNGEIEKVSVAEALWGAN